MDKKEKPVKVIVAISFLIMIVVILLSIFLRFGGRNIVDITSSYPNYVTPSNYSNYIWILIYLLLGLFAIYQFDLYGDNHNQIRTEILNYSRIVFISFCWLVILWVVSWLNDYIALSAVVILAMLLSVKFLCKSLSNTELSRQSRWFIKLPFSILYGWLTISTVMTIVILFVSIGWKGLGIPIPIWATATLSGIAIYAAIRTQRNRDMVYCLTIIWGYIGILIKHISKTGLNGQYPQIIIAVIVSIVLLAGSAGFLLIRKKAIF